MPTPNQPQNPAPSSRAPRSGVRLMIIIVITMALLAIYANVQKSRRNAIEKVTIIPAPSATPVPSSPGQ